jgi:hypothetical protein
MASIQEDKMMHELSDDMDKELFKWLTTYEIPPLNLIAIMLARLTWLAKQGECTEDFLALLEAPKQLLDDQDKEKSIH